ncbi:ribitol-5-phosphate xylosyltransferase 1 [Hyalella azteca]|uniref:Ribitol-5-phosphate xylosyltransferase 1 n=1 Tax=Hyalella azteca TaxID=294128 RepID=A0A8B7NW80_HYAAZ|nr:ribitol-5-phosphate xylosyltransferase 1 [Hyalella azteca]
MNGYALSDRQREIAQVLGSLENLDFEQPVEFIPDDRELQAQPTVRRFIMRPLSILNIERHDRELNQLIVSDNIKTNNNKTNNGPEFNNGIKVQKSALILDTSSHGMSKASMFPVLKLFKLRPIEPVENQHLEYSWGKRLLETGSSLTKKSCNNSWVKKYVDSGLVQAVFLTFDDLIIDNLRYFQWPLGQSISTNLPHHNDPGQRKYRCSLWTSHSSSTGQLLTLIRPFVKRGVCSLTLVEDVLNATTKSLYLDSLRSADLVICPVGDNAETSVIYDAVAAGALPVLLNSPPDGGGGCDSFTFRLLKEAEAPFIWLYSWFDLQDVLEREKTLSEGAKDRRRRSMLRWYDHFQQVLAKRFIQVLHRSLLNISEPN